MKKDYKVGYRKPPEATRFKPGQSGNPAGRPKGAKGLAAVLLEELQRPVVVTINGDRKKISKLRLAVRQQVDNSLKGNIRAFQTIMKLEELASRRAGDNPSAGMAAQPEIPDEKYEEILEAHIQALLQQAMSADAISPAALVHALARKSFDVFLRLSFTHLNPDERLSGGWYIDALVGALEDVANGSCRRLLVTMPPRHLKSIVASVVFPAWLLGRNPRMKIMCVSHGGELAETHARDFRRIVESSWYRSVFPETATSIVRNTTTEVATSQGGYAYASALVNRSLTCSILAILPLRSTVRVAEQ